MTESIMAAVATALTTWGTTAFTESGRAAAGSLISLLRDRFGRGTAEREIVEDVLAGSADADAALRLARILEHAAEKDRQFGNDVSDCWRRISAPVHASDGGVANSIEGGVSGSVVQARDVYGGISIEKARDNPTK